MKKLYAAIVGYGNRGQVYAGYALDCPDEFGIAAIIDPNPFKLSEAKTRFNLSDDQLFTSYEEFEAKNVACDFVVNATMDQYHYETAMKILAGKHDMLMENPSCPTQRNSWTSKTLRTKTVVKYSFATYCVTRRTIAR